MYSFLALDLWMVNNGLILPCEFMTVGLSFRLYNELELSIEQSLFSQAEICLGSQKSSDPAPFHFKKLGMKISLCSYATVKMILNLTSPSSTLNAS